MMTEKNFDIIVAGGGFAGAAAAISAARQGKKTLLIEKYNCLGGAAAYDLVNPFMPYWTHDPADPKKRIDLSRGLFSELLERMKKEGGLKEANGCCTFNEEILKYVLNQMAAESGVHLLYQTYLTGVRREGRRLTSVTVSNVSGTDELSAACFIDATGDANLTNLAGASFTLGREGDHLCQPMTLCFRLANAPVHYSKDLQKRVNEKYAELQKKGEIRNPRENVLVFHTVVDGILHFNTTRVIRLNPTDGEAVTQAELIAREQVMECYCFLKENFEEFRDSVLLSTGIQIGARESRMIHGDYTLTEQDLLAFTKFEDGIAACNYDIDIHSPDGSGTSHYYFPNGAYYTIPYRCLISADADNLLAAGRCISATHEAQASVRIMPTCCTMGEAAGIAAAMAVEKNGDVRAIDIQELRSALRKNGALVD